MSDRILSNWVWVCVLASSACAPLGTGCAADCTQIKKDYASALEAEAPFVAGDPAGDPPMHFGIAVRDELLNEVVDRALREGLEKALTITDGIKLATGQKVGLSTEGSVADIGLYPDKACDECLRVDGRLGGSLTVTLPVLGAQKVPLSGVFSIVAPVKFGQTADGKAAVQLDLTQAATIAKSQVNPEVTQLPPTWWKVIERPLSRLMAEAVTRDLEPLTLFTFRGFDLGIEGLDVKPVRIVSDHKRGVIFAGFTTNLAAPEASLQPRTDLGKNDDVAVGIDRGVLGAMTVALVKSGKISRTWTKGGKAAPDGPIAITSPQVSLPDASEGKQPYQMTFRAWRVPNEGKCWWAQARAAGTVEPAEDGALRVGIDEVKIIESSLPGVFESIANWQTSRLLSKSSEVVTKTLAPQAVDFGGTSVKLEKSKIAIDGGGVWLSGNALVADGKASDGAQAPEDD